MRDDENNFDGSTIGNLSSGTGAAAGSASSGYGAGDGGIGGGTSAGVGGSTDVGGSVTDRSVDEEVRRGEEKAGRKDKSA